MSPWLLAWLGAAFGLTLTAHLGLFCGVYLPVRRRLRAFDRERGANPPTLVPFRENNIGIDPEAAYLYAPFDVAPDEALIVRGRVDPVTPYASMSLYDTYLQGFFGRSGPTHLNDRDLITDADGHFEIVLAHHDLGWTQWLDIGGHARGVIAWRQAEGQIELPTLTRVPLADAMQGRTQRQVAPDRLEGPWAWAWLRAVYVAWLTVRAVVGWDFIYTIARGQDAADHERFEHLGARLDRDHHGRRLHLGARARPSFDMTRDYPEGSLGAHAKQHFQGAELDVKLAAPAFPMTSRGAWAKERWRHTHDIRHVLLGLGTTIPEEMVLHGFQFGQHRLWSGVIIMSIGFCLSILWLVPPWRTARGMWLGYQAGRRARLVVATPVEDWVDAPLAEVRRQLGIEPLGQRYGAQGFFPVPRGT